jgi:hypothetical protein
VLAKVSRKLLDYAALLCSVSEWSSYPGHSEYEGSSVAGSTELEFYSFHIVTQ